MTQSNDAVESLDKEMTEEYYKYTYTSMKRIHIKSHNPLFLTSLKVHTFSKALKSSLSLSLPLPASLSQRAQQMYPYNLQLMET